MERVGEGTEKGNEDGKGRGTGEREREREGGGGVGGCALTQCPRASRDDEEENKAGRHDC